METPREARGLDEVSTALLHAGREIGPSYGQTDHLELSPDQERLQGQDLP